MNDREKWRERVRDIYASGTTWYIYIYLRYVSRVKWSNPGKGVAPSPTPRCSSYWKGSLLVTLDYGRQLYLLYMCVCTRACVCVCVSFPFVLMPLWKPCNPQFSRQVKATSRPAGLFCLVNVRIWLPTIFTSLIYCPCITHW